MKTINSRITLTELLENNKGEALVCCFGNYRGANKIFRDSVIRQFFQDECSIQLYIYNFISLDEVSDFFPPVERCHQVHPFCFFIKDGSLVQFYSGPLPSEEMGIFNLAHSIFEDERKNAEYKRQLLSA